MGVFSWIVAAGAAAGGYYCYRRLRGIEQEIRSEEEQPAPPAPPVSPQKGRVSDSSKGPREVGRPLAERLSDLVRKEPGILQTELYRRFPDENRRALQEQIREMVEEGSLRREKEKSTFRLFPGRE